MIAAVCIDDRNGLLFNGRRLSRDRAQQDDLLAFCGGRLWMAPYSAPLFAGREEQITAVPDFLSQAGTGEVCFIEAPLPAPCKDRVEAVLLYRWNRAYPADTYWNLDLAAGFVLTERLEFPGTSHERITRELYQRGGDYGKT